jgi:hypothetical protein
MKNIKTSELTGAALDWAVAKCEGHNVFNKHAPVQVMYTPKGKRSWYIYTPSTNWAQGGPIIERMKLNRLTTNALGGYTASVKVTLTNTDDDAYMVWTHGSGPTPLIAAMRCYVASKLGDTVEVSEELL